MIFFFGGLSVSSVQRLVGVRETPVTPLDPSETDFRLGFEWNFLLTDLRESSL